MSSGLQLLSGVDLAHLTWGSEPIRHGLSLSQPGAPLTLISVRTEFMASFHPYSHTDALQMSCCPHLPSYIGFGLLSLSLQVTLVID